MLMVVFAISCDTKKIETSRQLFAKEQERLNTFLNTVPHDSIFNNPDKLTYLEYWTRQAVDTVDNSRGTGLIYFENVTGTGDEVTYGKEVGYGYSKWVIDVDEEDKVGMFSIGEYNYNVENNYNDLTFRVGAEDTGVPMGIQSAIQYMRMGGKSMVIVPSTLDDGRYRTYIYFIKITWLSE